MGRTRPSLVNSSQALSRPCRAPSRRSPLGLKKRYLRYSWSSIGPRGEDRAGERVTMTAPALRMRNKFRTNASRSLGIGLTPRTFNVLRARVLVSPENLDERVGHRELSGLSVCVSEVLALRGLNKTRSLVRKAGIGLGRSRSSRRGGYCFPSGVDRRGAAAAVNVDLCHHSARNGCAA